MRIAEARTTAKKVLTLNDIKGVDLSSAPLSVKPTRASYMKNMICKGGVNHKRNGFVQAAQFFDIEGNGAKINGIYPLSKEEHFAVHTGSDLICCNSDFVSNGTILSDGIELADEKSQGFYANGALYLVSGTHLYYYDTNEDDGLLPLFDNEKAYVPTTSIGITDKENGSLLESFEEVNLFSTKRINKLMGQRNEILTGDGSGDNEYNISTYELGSSATFYLDGKIDLTKSVTVTADVYIANQYGENHGEKWTMPLNAFWDGDSKVASNCSVNTVFEFGEMYDDGTDPVVTTAKATDGTISSVTIEGKSTLISNGASVTVEAFVEDSSSNTNICKFKCTIGNIGERGVITFTPALPSPVLGEDNITVKYSVAKEEPKIKCACEMTVAAYNKQLAIVTEDDMVYYSSPFHGWGYFPDKSYIKSINNVSAIFDGDGSLVVSSKRESAVISFDFKEDDDGVLLVPKMSAKYSSIGSISPYASANVEGDTLILTEKGVYGVNASGAHLRSSNINKELLSFRNKDFESALALEHDGRYYLFIGGVVYIADARYKTYESNRLDVSYEYEWWRWELDTPVSVLCHDNEMYLGKSDGRVLYLSDGYADRETLELENGEYTFNGEAFTLDKDINLNGANLEIANAYKKTTYISDVDKKLTEISGGVITNGSTESLLMEVTYSENFDKIIDRALLFEGLKVFVSVPDTEVEFEGEIETINLEYNAVNIKVPDYYIRDVVSFGGPVPVNLYPYVARDVYTLEQTENDGDYYLKDRDGNRTLFYKYDEMTAKLIYDKPVECELHSAVLNLGSDIKEKVLHELCFVPSIDTTGVVQLGFETNKNGALEDVGNFSGLGIVSTPSVSGELDVGALDFNNFTHDTSFARTFKKRLHERGVEFVKFKLASKTADDFGVERLSCIYSYYTR